MTFLTDDILEQFVRATNAYSDFMKACKQASLACYDSSTKCPELGEGETV